MAQQKESMKTQSDLPIYLLIDGRTSGPYNHTEVMDLLSTDQITLSTRAYREDLPGWITLRELVDPPRINPPPPPETVSDQPVRSVAKKKTTVRLLAGLTIVAGICLTAFFLFAFHTDVEADHHRIPDIGLLNDRLLGVLVSLAITHWGFLALWRSNP